MQIKNQLESFKNLIFSNNITSHNVNLNAASVLKSGYSYVVSALEKFFSPKGLPPPNSIQVSNSSNSNINQNYFNNNTILLIITQRLIFTAIAQNTCNGESE